LTDLDLSKNSFGDHSGVVLGPILASNDHLETLDLSWNKIRTKGGISIAKGLKVRLWCAVSKGYMTVIPQDNIRGIEFSSNLIRYSFVLRIFCS